MVDSNAAGFAALNDMIARCRALEEMPKAAAPAVANLLRESIALSIATQTTPEGEAWKPTADGHAPLQGAMSAIAVEARGTMVIVTLSGYHIFHQIGRQSSKGRALERAAHVASGAARKLEKKIERASVAVGKRKTKKGKERAAAKVAKLTEQHATLTGTASRARAAHTATVGVGGLPARPMIPRMLSGKTGYAIRELYRQRFEAITGGAG